jgi:hypothetical protein
MGMMKPSSLLSFLSPIFVLSLLWINQSVLAACQEPTCDEDFGDLDESWDVKNVLAVPTSNSLQTGTTLLMKITSRFRQLITYAIGVLRASLIYFVGSRILNGAPVGL